jgi:hypothetical protein
MNVLDENIPESQRQLLRGWRIQVRQIGNEIGNRGMKDDAIISLLHQFRSVAFFTRDLGFYDNKLCHANYCLVCLAVGQYEVASFIRRFLHHVVFNTSTKRMGKVIKVTHLGMRIWQQYAEEEEAIEWD